MNNARHRDLDGDVDGDDMKKLTKFALRHVLSLVICLLSLCALSFAQEVDVPSGRGSG